MNHSLVSIVPVAHRDALNMLGVALGWSAGEHSVALSADGSEPATHYGLRAWASEQTFTTFSALIADPDAAPPVPGYTAEQIAAAIEAVTQDWRPDAPDVGAEHWADALTALGLQTMSQEP